ncbi:TIGR01777 family oxidoreductase [Corynebacterium doosanense]|uniref:Nucleoside-diphosphate sugar epimerase n=1 Tax=Corynebacterium doosanense CAU 212 = DSM 45436 TaxID=558173 RepID=A0A097IG96_9CORY|nr:TIGR01777 family oxidoreductase [Corynebacterium doosanense]AIT61168.1 nucleoside-diphosphate sugar epimerase [Corynebacterium doosanense CAU 212 = DSM 45436]
MSFTADQLINFPRDLVWNYHTRSGAVTRLTPGFLPMRPVTEANSLRGGMTVFSLPGGLRWNAQHLPEGYVEGSSFRDICVNSPLRQITQWTHTHNFSDDPSGGTRITDEVSTRIPERLLRPAFAYRQHQLEQDLAFLARQSSTPLTIAMTGSSGTVGSALWALLTVAGHTIIPLVRGEASDGERHWDMNSPAPELLHGVDVLVHLAGEPIFGRFNDSHKAKIYASRVGPTRRLAEIVASSPQVSAMISASAIGYYGAERGDEPLDEDSAPGEDFLAHVVTDWENATAPAERAGKRVVTVRTGIVLSGGGGMLPLLSAAISTGLGGPFGDGRMWMSWIALDDLTDIYATAVVDSGLTGPVNAVAPHPVRNRGLVKALGRELHRPAFVPLPKFAPAVLLGRDGARELALADQRVSNTALAARGHFYRYPDLAGALAHELGGQSLA